MKSIFHVHDYRALLARVDSLRPDSPRRWGRMSPHGAVKHLTDAFALVLGERARTGDDSHLPTPGALVRAAGRFYALTSPLPWPRGAPTSAAADQEKEGTPPGDFAADVEALLEVMERFRARDGRDMGPHVYFGPLSRAEWGRWGYRHVDHHLRQFGV